MSLVSEDPDALRSRGCGAGFRAERRGEGATCCSSESVGSGVFRGRPRFLGSADSVGGSGVWRRRGDWTRMAAASSKSWEGDDSGSGAGTGTAGFGEGGAERFCAGGEVAGGGAFVESPDCLRERGGLGAKPGLGGAKAAGA